MPLWSLRGKKIRRVFECGSFADAIAFVGRVAAAAEKKDHHPDIDIRWNKVALSFTTHSKGGLTRNDFMMARIADRLLERRGAG
jgi:4a-hydroxytetrahydrobiopterin dehydratase